MPVVQLVTAARLTDELRAELIRSLVVAFASELKIPANNVHVWLLDGQSFAYGGDPSTPGVYATVKSAAHQILPEQRKALVETLVPLLQRAIPDLETKRVTTYFEELPVENISVGKHITVFGTASLGRGYSENGAEGPAP